MRRWRVFFTGVPMLALFVLFLFNTTLAADGVRRGLALCAKSIFPTLFPFLVISELILSSEIGTWLCELLGRPLGKLFGISNSAAGAFAMGVLCGQPVASCAAVSLCVQKRIGANEVVHLSLFANNPSIGFLVAAIGGALFGNTTAGIALFCITLLSAVIVGTLLRFFVKKEIFETQKGKNGVPKQPFSLIFTQAVKRGATSLFCLGSFLVFFSALTSVLGGVLQNTPFPQKLQPLLFGLLEITTGIHGTVAVLPAYSAFRLSAFLCGFGGVCVCMQILSITQEQRPMIWRYLLVKLFQGGVALLLCEGYLRFFHPVLTPNKTLPTFAPTAHLPVLGGMLFLLLLALLWRKKFP